MFCGPQKCLLYWSAQPEHVGFARSSRCRSGFLYTEPDSWVVDRPALVEVVEHTFVAECVTVLSNKAALERQGSVVSTLLDTTGTLTDDLSVGWNKLRNARSEMSGF